MRTSNVPTLHHYKCSFTNFSFEELMSLTVYIEANCLSSQSSICLARAQLIIPNQARLQATRL